MGIQQPKSSGQTQIFLWKTLRPGKNCRLAIHRVRYSPVTCPSDAEGGALLIFAATAHQPAKPALQTTLTLPETPHQQATNRRLEAWDRDWVRQLNRLKSGRIGRLEHLGIRNGSPAQNGENAPQIGTDLQNEHAVPCFFSANSSAQSPRRHQSEHSSLNYEAADRQS